MLEIRIQSIHPGRHPSYFTPWALVSFWVLILSLGFTELIKKIIVLMYVCMEPGEEKPEALGKCIRVRPGDS